MISATPPSSPISRLLLACCRFNPDLGRIAQLASDVHDWTGCASFARHHLIGPKIYACFKDLPQNTIPTSVLQSLAENSKDASIVSLLHQAELKQLIDTYLRPLGIHFLVVKGVTLAARYYRAINLRQARDIDLLIAPNRLNELTFRLLEDGYRINAIRLINSPDGIRAFCETNAEINMTTPRGVAIQLHKLLDFTGCQYPVPAEDLIEMGEACKVGSFDCPVLPTNELFIYISYHHCRHQWSRMHWIADLDGLFSHATFDPMAVAKRARTLGMEEVVQAAIGLHHSLFEDASRLQPKSRFAKKVERDCITNLQESADPPEKKRRALRGTGAGIVKAWLQAFDFNWHANSRWSNRIRYLLSLPRPTYADYLFAPLPATLFALYVFIRPVRICFEVISGKQIGSK